MRRLLICGLDHEADPGDATLLAAFRHGLPEFELHPVDAELRHHNNGGGSSLRQLARSSAGLLLTGPNVLAAPRAPVGRRADAFLVGVTTLAVAARALDRPVAAVGISAARPRTKTARLLANRLVQACGLVVLRDSDSVGALAAAGVPTPMRVGADPAWNLLPPPLLGVADRGGPVVLTVDDRGEPHRAGLLADALARVRIPGRHVVLLPWRAGAADRRLAETVARHCSFPTEIAEAADTLNDALHRLRGTALLLGTRVHALMLGMTLGVRTAAVGEEAGMQSFSTRMSIPVLSGGEPDGRPGSTLGAIPDGDRLACIDRERRAAAETMGLTRIVMERGAVEYRRLEGLQLEPQPWR